MASSDPDEVSRMADSAETALFEGNGRMELLVWDGDGTLSRRGFSTRFEADGMTFVEPSDQMFNFNNPYGACPRCDGFGKTMGIDERLVVPDPAKSVFEDAVVCWRGEKMSEWKQMCISAAASTGFPIHRPYAELTAEQKDFLWHGGNGFTGIDGFFRMVEENTYKIQYRVMLARYRGKTLCPECHGTRLRKDALYVRVGGHTIADLVVMPVESLRELFVNLELNDTERLIARRLLPEIISRLTFLCDVGLGYLTLDRLSSTLSGGESQRINLATSLGSSLVGSLYILDEPSIGLHSRDTDRLIGVLRKLQGIGNTVVVVEHDEEIMRAADHLIDVGRRPDVSAVRLSTAARVRHRQRHRQLYGGLPARRPENRHTGHPAQVARRHNRQWREGAQSKEHRRTFPSRSDDGGDGSERIRQVHACPRHFIPRDGAPSWRPVRRSRTFQRPFRRPQPNQGC